MNKVICTGSPNTEDEAIKWLKNRGGAQVESYAGITIISLPEAAEIKEDEFYKNKYTISFYGPDGNTVGRYIEMYLDPDANQTELYLCGEAPKVYYNFVYKINEQSGLAESFRMRFLMADGESFAKAPGYFEKTYQYDEVEQAHADIKAKANEREPQTVEFVESAQEFESLYQTQELKASTSGLGFDIV